MRTSYFIGVGIVVALLMFALAAYGVVRSQPRLMLSISFAREWALSRIAHDIISDCAKAGYRPACYDKEIPNLLDRGVSMEDAFAVTAVIQRTVPDYFYCHILGHNVASKETAKDPSKWASVIERCPVGQCASGCLHGVMFDRFENVELSQSALASTTALFSHICEDGNGRMFTGLEHYSCYHGLGHMVLYVTGPDPKKALQTCTDVTGASKQPDDLHMAYARKCYEGLFMEIFQPFEPEDVALVKDIAPHSLAESKKFCSTFEGEYAAACHRESWPLNEPNIEASSGLHSFCEYMPNQQFVQDCYNVVVYSLTVKFAFDEVKIQHLCDGLPLNRLGQCYAHAASRFVETDYSLAPRAVALCQIATQKGVGERCFNELLFYSFFNYHAGSSGFKALCSALPVPWKQQCLDGAGAKLSPYVLDTNVL